MYLKKNKTKHQLAQSLKQLMKKKALDKITIQDITAACNLTRSTFYNNFIDKEDLIDWIFLNEISGQIEEQSHFGEPGIAYTYFKLMEQQRDFLIKAMRYHSHNSLRQQIYQRSFQNMMNSIEEICGAGIDSQEKLFYADFFASATTSVAINWIKDGMAESPEILEKRFFTITQHAILNTFKHLC